MAVGIDWSAYALGVVLLSVLHCQIGVQIFVRLAKANCRAEGSPAHALARPSLPGILAQDVQDQLRDSAVHLLVELSILAARHAP